CDLFDISVPLLIEHLPLCSTKPQPLLETLLAEGHHLGILRPATRLSLCLEVPQLSLEQYLPTPPNLMRQRTPQSRPYTPRKHAPRPSGYRKKRAKAEATKQVKAQRCARTKAVKAPLSASDSS